MKKLSRSQLIVVLVWSNLLSLLLVAVLAVQLVRTGPSPSLQAESEIHFSAAPLTLTPVHREAALLTATEWASAEPEGQIEWLPAAK